MKTLRDVRVIEWNRMISAAYCTHLLQEFGAAVDKIEAPEGDPARHHGPFPNDRPNTDASGLFVYLNSGKRSLVADMEETTAREKLHALLARADVFVTNQPLALRRRLGFDAPTLRTRHPHLLCVSISVFGDTGPRALAPAESIDACAASGTAWVIGDPAREPLIVPLQQADYQAGAHAACAVLVARLGQRRREACAVDGRAQGQAIDIASADILAASVGTNGLVYLAYGQQRWERSGRRAFASGGPYPYVILPCRDGAVCLIGRARHEWARLVQAMGTPDWTLDPRYQDLAAMGRDYPEEVDALLMPWLAKHTRTELLALAAEFGFPLAPLRTMREVIGSAQFEERGFFRDVPHPTLGQVRVPGVPWQVAGAPMQPLQAAPRLGEHSAQILAELEG